MLRLYMIGLLGAIFMAAYFVGHGMGIMKCREQVAVEKVNAIQTEQLRVIQTQRKINAEANNLGVADIRDRLRRAYTIAE